MLRKPHITEYQVGKRSGVRIKYGGMMSFKSSICQFLAIFYKNFDAMPASLPCVDVFLADEYDGTSSARPTAFQMATCDPLVSISTT